jgi:hypothetical protein
MNVDSCSVRARERKSEEGGVRTSLLAARVHQVRTTRVYELRDTGLIRIQEEEEEEDEGGGFHH